MTLPMMHSSTAAGSIPARATASRTAIAPRSVALKSFRTPRNLPVGVRTAEMMTLSLISDLFAIRGVAQRLRRDRPLVELPCRPRDHRRNLILAEDLSHLAHHAVTRA